MGSMGTSNPTISGIAAFEARFAQERRTRLMWTALYGALFLAAIMMSMVWSSMAG
jgi:hypothetical protein